MDSGINTHKNLNTSIGCRQTVAGEGCIIKFCIQSILGSYNECNKAIIVHAYCIWVKRTRMDIMQNSVTFFQLWSLITPIKKTDPIKSEQM